jgi:type IV fimbrial biogenesis protein FimT
MALTIMDTTLERARAMLPAWSGGGLSERTRGFTIIELMITLAIAAILITLAAPSFKSFILDQRVRTASFEVLSTLNFARSEAIKRNANVTVTPAAGGWSNGWTVADGGGTTLKTQSALNSLAITGPAGAVTYGRTGRIAAAVSFSVDASPTNSTVIMRCVDVDPSGRPHSKLDKNADKDCTNES